jgi:hypothetical protein
MDPRKSKRPELPVTGPGRGGRVGASATQHVVQNLVRDTTRDDDVRATCLFFRLGFFFRRWLRCRVLVAMSDRPDSRNFPHHDDFRH